MTVPQIIQRLTIGVMRDDLVPLFPDFVNEALIEIQRRRSWQIMRTRAQFTVKTGTSSVSLAVDDNSNTTNFKELTGDQSPVHLLNANLDSLQVPCEVWTREKILRRQARLISNSLLYSVYSHPETARRVQIPVWIDMLNEQPVLNILFNAQDNMPFIVSYYGYLAAPTNDGANTNHNYFTDFYSEMVVAKAKSLAFAAINDPAMADFEGVFEKKFKEAAANDAYHSIAGLFLRM